MKWPGPLKGGVTQSLLSKFLEDPYGFYLYAGLGLEEPGSPEPNLVWGCIAHTGLEHIIEIPYTINEFTPEDWNGIHAAIDEYIYRDWPMALPTYAISVKNMIALYDDSYKSDHGPFVTEQKFSVEHKTSRGNIVTLRGKADGVSGLTLVEHKCKGKIDINQTRAETFTDLQVTVYCKVLGTRQVIYDLIRIPDTQWSLPPKRQYEQPKSYINSLYTDRIWGDFPVSKKKHLWLQQCTLELTDEQIERNMAETVDPLIDKLCKWYLYVSDPNFDFQNPSHYNDIFYKTPIRHFDPARTQSYKSAYWNHRTDAIDIEDMQPVRSFYAELDDEVTK